MTIKEVNKRIEEYKDEFEQVMNEEDPIVQTLFSVVGVFTHMGLTQLLTKLLFEKHMDSEKGLPDLEAMLLESQRAMLRVFTRMAQFFEDTVRIAEELGDVHDTNGPRLP